MRIRFLYAGCVWLMAIQLHLQAQAPAQSPSGPPSSVVIVELFTSEGCSSCPPADALLQKVHFKQTSAGQLIVGLSEHVTYWNNLGWKDPYSDQAFTDRQELYATRLSPEGAYTPQMVLNGRDQFVGSNGSALAAALCADASRKHADLSIVSSARNASGLEITFSLSKVPSKPLEIIAVVTDDEAHSTVLRGENSGSVLQHVSVARDLLRLGTVNGDTVRSVHIPLSASFGRDGGAGHHLVVFAQEPHQGAIVGAAITAI